MPRCGCQDACSCLIVAGEGISVEGIGTLERPYEITSESSDLVDRIVFTDDGNVDFTVTGVGTINDPTTVFADAKLAVTDLTDVSPTDTPVEGDVLVWRIDHWEFEQQSGSGGGAGLPPGGTDGQVLTKQSGTDGDANWEDPTGGGGAVMEPVYSSSRGAAAGQSIPASTITVVNLDTEIYTDGIPWNDPSSPGQQFRIPVDGYYQIDAQIMYAGGNSTGSRWGYIYRNTIVEAAASVAPTTGASQVSVTLSETIKCVAGDYITLRTNQSTAGAFSLYADARYTGMSITKVPTLQPGGGGVVVEKPISAMRRHLAATSILNSTLTAVAFDTEVYTDGITWDAANAAFIAPSDGYYDVAFGVTYATSATGVRVGYIQVGGVSQAAANGDGTGNAVSGSATVKALAGQLIKIMTQQSSGAALALNGNAIYNWMSVTKVPAAYSGSAVSTYGEQNYFACRGHAAATSIPQATSTIVPFDTASSSDGITWDGSGFVVPVAGLYDVEAVLTYAGSNTTGARYVLLAVDGGSQFSSAVPGSVTASGATVAATLKLAAGQRIEVRAYQTSGAALALSANPSYNRVSVTKVPAPVINGAAASGVFGVAPLNIYGNGNDKMGREVYIDTAGQLRSAPSVMDFADNGFTAATPIGSYPQGFSILSFNTAANTDWPVTAMPGQVNTMRRNSYGVQHFFLEKDGAAANQAFFFRITYGGAPGTWGPWQAVWQDTGWLALTGIASGWTVPSPYVTPQARLLNGEVIFRGRLVNATFTGGYTDLAVLPATIPRPTDTSTFPAATNTPATKAIQVMTGGVVQIYQSAASGAHLDFASVRYPIN